MIRDLRCSEPPQCCIDSDEEERGMKAEGMSDPSAKSMEKTRRKRWVVSPQSFTENEAFKT